MQRKNIKTLNDHFFEAKEFTKCLCFFFSDTKIIMDYNTLIYGRKIRIYLNV